jgi:hypothetical protein
MIHLTHKNLCIWLFGVCAVFLAAIGIIVPSVQWGLPPWKWVILGLIFAAVLAATIQLVKQSSEDHDREEKEAKRDEMQESIVTQLKQLVPRGSPTSENIATQSMNPPVNFDASKYFLTAYHSMFTEDVEKRIRVAAEQNKSHYAPEDFYTKFISVGFVAYLHDITWAYIFKSQILMMIEMNRRGGYLPIAEANKFYDQAVIDYPNVYSTYSFDQWIAFLAGESLFLKHPSNMLEISTRGRDLLSYLGHYSRTADQKVG